MDNKQDKMSPTKLTNYIVNFIFIMGCIFFIVIIPVEVVAYLAHYFTNEFDFVENLKWFYGLFKIPVIFQFIMMIWFLALHIKENKKKKK